MAESFNVFNNTDKSTVKSCKSATFESGNLSFDEEIEFKMFLIYTYIYALMKLPRFIPDDSLRANIIKTNVKTIATMYDVEFTD